MNQAIRILPVLKALSCFLWLLCLAMPLQAQRIKMQPSPSKTTFTFHPIRLSRQHQNVVLEVKGRGVYKENGRDRIPSIVATFYAVQGQKRLKLYSTDLADYLFSFVDVSLYRHEGSGHYLLAVEANGGRYDHTQVYLIDPSTLHLRPLFEDIGVIWGDPSELSRGRLVEHTYDQYVAEEELPADFQQREPHLSEHLSRVWTYVPSKNQFQPGRYRWDKEALETELNKRKQAASSSDSKLTGLVRQWYALEQKENASLAEVQSHNRLPAQLYSLGKPGRRELMNLRQSSLLSSDENLAHFRWKAIAELGDAGLEWLVKSPNREEILKEFHQILSPDLRSEISKRFLNRMFTGEQERIRLLLVQKEAVPYAHAQRMTQGGVGKLGRVTAELAAIYAMPASKGQVITEAPRDTYLALTTKKGQFYGVRMADDSTGYIATQDMELVDYFVLSPEPEGKKRADQVRQEITGNFPSPNRTVECYTTFGKDDSGTRLFVRRRGSKEPGQLLMENGRWMKVHWAPNSRLFAVEDHWDGHVSDVSVYEVSLSGKNASVRRVAHSPALRTYNVMWEVERWDLKRHRLIIRDSFDPNRKSVSIPLPAQ